MTFTQASEEFRIDPVRHSGRPADRRSPAEMAVYALLDDLGVLYDRADHDPAMTIALCRAVEQVLLAPVCKNLFLCNRQKTQFYLLLMSGNKPFRTKHLSNQLNCARLSFAGPEDMERLLGVTPGSATVLALAGDGAGRVTLVIDRPVLQASRFACHPCVNTSTVAFSTLALTEKILPALGHTPVLVDLPEESDP